MVIKPITQSQSTAARNKQAGDVRPAGYMENKKSVTAGRLFGDILIVDDDRACPRACSPAYLQAEVAITAFDQRNFSIERISRQITAGTRLPVERSNVDVRQWPELGSYGRRGQAAF